MDNIDIAPDYIIEAFVKRIEKLFVEGADKEHPSIKRELDLVERVNGRIPNKITELLENINR